MVFGFVLERAWCLRSYQGRMCELLAQTPPDAWTSPAGSREKHGPEPERDVDVALLSRRAAVGGEAGSCPGQPSPAGRAGFGAAVPPVTSGAARRARPRREANVARLCGMCRPMTEDAFELKRLHHPEAFLGRTQSQAQR